MPLHSNDHSYSTRGTLCHRTITRVSQSSYPRACLTTRFAPTPYPTMRQVAARIDADTPNDPWYNQLGDDLFYRDFIFQTHLQSARWMAQRMDQFPGRDCILERLMLEGTFDREESGLHSDAEEYALHHATAMCQRLLVRIEDLEGLVSIWSFSGCDGFLIGLLDASGQAGDLGSAGRQGTPMG